jgi:hypothetical protein
MGADSTVSLMMEGLHRLVLKLVATFHPDSAWRPGVMAWEKSFFTGTAGNEALDARDSKRVLNTFRSVCSASEPRMVAHVPMF